MPLALTTMRGCALNWRLGGNGSQSDCRSFGAPVARSCSSSIPVSCVSIGMRCRGGPYAALARLARAGLPGVARRSRPRCPLGVIVHLTAGDVLALCLRSGQIDSPGVGMLDGVLLLWFILTGLSLIFVIW